MQLPSWWSVLVLVLTAVIALVSGINGWASQPFTSELLQALAELFTSGVGIIGILRAIRDAFVRWKQTGTQTLKEYYASK